MHREHAVQYTTTYLSPVGTLTIISNDRAVQGLWMEQHTSHMEQYLAGKVCMEQETPVLQKAKRWLDAYFAGRMPTIVSLPLAPEGTPFRMLVWQLLCQIPYGETRTYGDIAREAARLLGKKTMSAQAVGGAVGHNPVSIIIPCHRVIGANGTLVGYGGGLHHKRWLLHHEGCCAAAEE